MNNRRIMGASASLFVLLTVGACSSTNHDKNSAELTELQAQQTRLDTREKELERMAADLSSRESSLANSSAQPFAAGSEPLLPPNATAGQCFTRVWQPPAYQTRTENRLVSDASEKIEIIPAKYMNSTKQVLIQEASTKIVAVPATYKTVTERVLVQPARTSVVQVPAVYETVTERVIDKPAHTTWKKGTGPIQRIDDTTGEIMCLVEVPATYKTIKKRILKTPATTKTKEFPAKYETVKKRVIDQPATTKTVAIPEKYGTVKVVELAEPAQEKRIPVPAKYAEVKHTELVADGKMQWREILCETNTTPQRVAKIQTALKSAGFDPGPIDGDVGASTMRAVNAFQQSKGLPVDRYLNVDTVRALGVSTQ